MLASFLCLSVILMQVKLTSVIKTSHTDFDCFDEGRYIFRAGNTLCVKDISKNQSAFICLSKHITRLFSFKPMTNCKGVFTAEKHTDSVEIGQYSLSGERKGIELEGSFFKEIEKVDLLVDEYDNNMLYGFARGKEGSCLFLADFAKGKVMAAGYLPNVEDFKVDSRDNATLSVCGHNGNNNYVKILRYGHGQWEIEEELYKRIQGVAIKHELLPCARTLFATSHAVYIYEDTTEVQHMAVSDGIVTVLKIPRGIILVAENNRIRLLVEDSDEVTFQDRGELQLSLDEGDSINKVVVTQSTEELLLRTNKNVLYMWRVEHMDREPGHSELAFTRMEESCTGEKEGSLSISTGKRYCLMSGPKVVTLWSVERNEFVLSSEFEAVQQNSKKNILASAINPDGNSFMLAFQDRIKIYSVLLTKFKFYAQFSIRRCMQIVYGHGGQLVACHFGRGANACIVIINTLRLVEVCTLKVQAEPVQFMWNQHDDQLIVTTETNSLVCYRVADNTKMYGIKFDQRIRRARIDYRTKRILVSTKNHIHLVDGGKVLQTQEAPFEDFDYVFPLYNYYFIAGLGGSLYWSQSLRFDHYSQRALFTNRPFELVCRNCYLLAYCGFEQVTAIYCQRPGYVSKKSSVDDLVMIQKDEVLGLFERVKVLDSNFEMLQSATQIKLEDEHNNYEKAVTEFKSRFTSQIKFLNQKFSQLGMEKLKQERETQSMFEQVETGQVKSVNQLEKMYERNFALEKEKYMDLEQNFIQQKLNYQKLILDLQKKYHKDVGQIREEYKNRVGDEAKRAEQVKKRSMEDKQRTETKFINLQEENEVLLTSMQQEQDHYIKNLVKKITQLEEFFDSEKVKCQSLTEELQNLQDEHNEKAKELLRVRHKLEESVNRVRLLEGELQQKNTMIEERDQKVKEQDHHIGDLEKAKYVLSFRTTEIRKELEPKQALVDNLKSTLFKLDEEYKDLKKTLFEHQQKIQKLTHISETTKKQNMDLKTALKYKERVHDELCYELLMIKTSVDPSKWNEEIIKLYKTYVKEDKFKSRVGKKKDATSEEINRHLIHVEQSLEQVSKGNNRVLKGKQKEVRRKMKENEELILQINDMRKKEKQFMKEKSELAIANDRLKREVNESRKMSRRNSTRAQTANTGLTRRMTASRDAISRDKSNLLDVSQFEGEMRARNKEKSRIASHHKTLMFRDDRFEKSAKLIEMVKELHSARNTIKVQDEMIEELNKQLFGGEEN